MRDERIDFWRGLCLLGMASWHLLTHPSFPRAMSFAIIQPFNFVAEGFVLLAGAAIGLKIARGGAKPGALVRRAGSLLMAHYALVAFVLLLAVLERKFGLAAQLNTRPSSVWNVINLSYQPYLADILSVFVFLFVAAPLCQLLYRRFGSVGLAAASLLVFMTASFYPINTGGAFDFNSWQLVFVAGILFGANYQSWTASAKARSNQWILICVLVFTGAFLVRALIAGPDGTQLSGWHSYLSFSRKPLTVARLVYIGSEMMLIALLTVRWWERLSRSAFVARIVMLGRSSLPVFACSVVLDYILKAAVTEFRVSFPANVIVWLIELAVLFALADLLNGRVSPKRVRSLRGSELAVN